MFLESSPSQSTSPVWDNLCCRESWVQVFRYVTISHGNYWIFPPLNVKRPANLTVLCKSFLLKTADTCNPFRQSLSCCVPFNLQHLMQYTQFNPKAKSSNQHLPLNEKGTATWCCTKMATNQTHSSYWWVLRECKSWQTLPGSWRWGSQPGAGCWLQGQWGQVPRGSMSRTLLPAPPLKLDPQVNSAWQLQRQGLWQDINSAIYTYRNASPPLKAAEGSSCLALKAAQHFWWGSRHTAESDSSFLPGILLWHATGYWY